MTEHAEATRGISEAGRDLVRRLALEEIRAQGLVLALDGVGRFEKRPREWC
jgi:hypothetical protein